MRVSTFLVLWEYCKEIYAHTFFVLLETHTITLFVFVCLKHTQSRFLFLFDNVDGTIAKVLDFSKSIVNSRYKTGIRSCNYNLYPLAASTKFSNLHIATLRRIRRHVTGAESRL